MATAGFRAVGADASLLYGPAGSPTIAYQDSTEIDLLYARRTEGADPLWSTEVLNGSGFYASQARSNSTALITNVDVTFDAEGVLFLDLSVLTQDL